MSSAADSRDEAIRTRRIRVLRSKRRPWRLERYDTFEIPAGQHTTMLDALHLIRGRFDSSLAVRSSCLHASCGTCGVRVNGREVLACVTRLADVRGVVTVEPLANLPVLADLVVDMRPFYARLPGHEPFVRRSDEPSPEEHDGRDWLRFEDCIECGLCLSACPVAATSSSYVGPAALAAAQRLLEEPRGIDRDELLDWADGDDGVWRCHGAYECTRACPADVSPAERIMRLRGALLRRSASSHGSRTP